MIKKLFLNQKSLKIFILLILTELLIIVYLTRLIITKSKNILGTKSINPIKKENIIFPNVKDLKYFYEPKPNTIDNVNEWSPYKGIYTINSDALNERYEYQIEKPKNVFRIITLGDSFTYGLYVDTKDNWTEKLEDLLNQNLECKNSNKFEVINLGVHGYDLQYSVERFKLRGQKYNPDLVIWLIVDTLRIHHDIASYSAEILKELEKNNDFSKINSYYPWAKAREKTIEKYGEENILEFQLEQIKKLDDYFRKKLILAFISDIPKSHINYLSQIKETRTSTYTTLVNGERFPTDGHPNQNGHLQIAYQFFDFIKKNKIIPCD